MELNNTLFQTKFFFSFKVTEEVENAVREQVPRKTFEIGKRKGLEYFLRLQTLLPGKKDQDRQSFLINDKVSRLFL